MKRQCSVAGLLAFVASLASSQEISSEPIGPGQFRLVLKSPVILEVTRAQQLLLPKAHELCQGLEPVLGHYTFRSQSPISGQSVSTEATEFELTQDVSCGENAGAQQLASARNSAFGVVKTDRNQSLEDFVRAASITHLQLRAEGAFEQAYGAFSEAMRGYQPLDEWKKQNSEFNAAAGKPKATTVWRITVYDNPPNAPEAGVYIAADYESEFERVAFQCGYLIWFQSTDERYVITREETGALPHEQVERLTKEQVSEVRRLFGCPAR